MNDEFEREQEENGLDQSERQVRQAHPGRKGDFARGIVVGISSALILVIICSVVIIGIRSIGRNPNQDQLANDLSQILENGSDSEDIQSAEQATEAILNMDLISQTATISAYLNDYFLYEVDSQTLREGMLKGLLEALNDPYSQYYNEEEFSSFNDSTEGEYIGIGASVTQELQTGIVRISRPYEGTPSAEAGLLPGDMIMTVDGTEVTGMDLTQVVALIKGEEGTSVVIHIYRESQEKELDITVERRLVEIPTVTYEMLENSVGYIEISSFDGVTAHQFQEAYEALKDQGMQRVIFDLRDNGGGLVDTVEEMLDYLLPEGTIFYVKDKTDTKSMEYISDASAALDIPSVVLVNGNTASASEIFAGNIQSFGLGQVVGTTTYGKGVMQQMFYTNDERTTAIKLTVADYYINGDQNINGIGVTPDIEVELDEEAATVLDLTLEQDNQLQAALEAVLAQ